MDLFLRNKSKLDNCRFGLFGNIKEPAVSMKQLAQKPQVEKHFFLSFKKIENLGSAQNPVLCRTMGRPKNMCKKTRKTGAGQCSMGVFSVSQKEQGKLS